MLLDEDPYSINDGLFANVGPNPANPKYLWIDWPATYHNFGANLAFGDGHAEPHTWQDARTQVQNGNVSQSIQPNNPDIVWLSERTTALGQPKISTTGPDAENNFTMSVVPGHTGAEYALQSKDSLSSTWWLGTSIPMIRYMGTNGGTVTFTVPATTNTQRFYVVLMR
jgi:prepilin-type processing-associated H-X9-DG protein